MTTRLVKILSNKEYQELFDDSEKIPSAWKGTAFDLSDGFMHLCFPHHVGMILSRYFNSHSEVYCLIFDAHLFGPELKIEDPMPPQAEMAQTEKDEGLLMPHLYGCLDLNKASVYKVTKDPASEEFDLSVLDAK